MTANAYSFLPWLRTGLSTRITGQPGPGRATIPVQLDLTGDALVAGAPAPHRLVEQPVQLYGPGDVIGVDPRAISRTEPRPFISNFEPNYLAHIEFYDEDFAWRYSPAPPDGGTKRLAPWLALIVLSAGGESGPAEFEDGNLPDRPLPFITVTEPRALQPPGELGAWAHVHVNGELDGRLAIDDPNNMGPALSNLTRVLREAPDSACCRVICPRHLRPTTTYHAFLVPAFETGRRAGLGIEPGEILATTASWGEPGMPASGQLPYYHRWTFTTSTAGDFEFLVRLLKPIEAKEPVGFRDMDAHRSPGFGLPGVTTSTEPHGVLRLGGALQLTGTDENVDAWENWDNYHQLPPAPAPQYPNQWQRALAGLINLSEDYQHQPAAVANTALSTQISGLISGLAEQTDPVITPPLYGRWHALTPKLLTEPDGTPVPETELRNWVHRLNLDPRYRVAAHYGTQVVQARQEELMAAAWQQLGDAHRANERIRAAQLAREIGNKLHAKHVKPLAIPVQLTGEEVASGRALTLTAPAHPRVLDRPGTPAPGAAASGAAASALPSALPDSGELFAVGFKVSQSRVATAPVSPPMRRITRPGSRLMKRLNTPLDTLVARIDEQQIAAAPEKGTPVAVVTPAKLAETLPGKPAGDPVDTLPRNPRFVLSGYGEDADAEEDAGAEAEAEAGAATAQGDEDSADAKAFKHALRELHEAWGAAEAAGAVEDRPKLGVHDTTAAMLTGLSADATVVENIVTSMNLPDRLTPRDGELTEVMAYPTFDMPMYEELLKMSTDIFMPNLGRLPPNSITLLENNRRFIESYLVGLNHEMAREMLWREYPTDQRGTPFRQFWDPRAALPLPNEAPDERRKRLYDILPIHEWGKTAALGENDNRPKPKPGQAPPEKKKSDLVLVIRGELLKKYPTAAIYAHKAVWPVSKKTGKIDKTGERELASFPETLSPPPELVRMPIYEAKVEPDIYLLGFNLDAETARGKDGDLGWFFVLKERPGDPRFGVDEDQPGPMTPVEVWNDLTWGRVDPATPNRHGFIQFDAGIHVGLDPFNNDEDDQEKAEQRTDDENVKAWQSDISSADVAYILFQAPVLMAIHAQEMLPDARPQP